MLIRQLYVLRNLQHPSVHWIQALCLSAVLLLIHHTTWDGQLLPASPLKAFSTATPLSSSCLCFSSTCSNCLWMIWMDKPVRGTLLMKCTETSTQRHKYIVCNLSYLAWVHRIIYTTYYNSFVPNVSKGGGCRGYSNSNTQLMQQFTLIKNKWLEAQQDYF